MKIPLYAAPPRPANSPDSETPAPENATFAAARRAEIESISNGPVRWTEELFSQSERWGRIWRADFWEPERKLQAYPTRVVCWTTDGGDPGMSIGGKWGGEGELKL